MFYTYRQNNSGGDFVVDKKRGIAQYVIIEADSAKKADLKAEQIGLYFEGTDYGRDCRCCGDRWYRADDGMDEDEVPSVYGKSVYEWQLSRPTRRRASDGFIHYADGQVKSFDRIYEETV